MKKLLILLIIVVIGGGAAITYKTELLNIRQNKQSGLVATSSAVGNGLNTYYNTAYGYSVEYSNDWSVDEGMALMPKDNVYFRPINFKKGDNWVEIYAGGKYVTSSNCSAATNIQLSGINAVREICKGGGGGIEGVNYYLTDNSGTPFVISVLYAQSADYKQDPLISGMKFNLPKNNKTEPTVNRQVLIKGKINSDPQSSAFSISELSPEDNSKLDCLIEGSCSDQTLSSNELTYNGRNFKLQLTASTTCARRKPINLDSGYVSGTCLEVIKAGDRVNVYGVLNGNKILVQSIENMADVPVANWLPHSDR